MNTQNTNTMTVADFKKQLRELQDKKFYGLTNQQIYSYIRIYYAVYMMVSVNALDDEYGDRHIYEAKLERLSKILLRRYKKTDNIIEKIEMLYMIFFLMQNVLHNIDCEDYLNEGAELIDNQLLQKETMSEADQYQLMRLIFVEWYGLVEDDQTETPASLVYAREQIKTWMSELNTDGSWNNITDMQALHRIILIAMNLTIMLDDQYDEKLETAYNHYCVNPVDSIDVSTKLYIEELERATVTYYALQRAPMILSSKFAAPSLTLVNLIYNQMINQNNHLELRTKCRCIKVDNMCQKISEEVQDKLFEEI